MNIHTFLITGTHALLMHNPSSMTNGSSSNKLGSKVIPTPAEEAAASRYLTDDGAHLWVPCEGVKACAVSGAKGRRIGKNFATTIIRGTVFPAEDRSILLDAKTLKPIKSDSYEIDTRRARVNEAGILRSRAKISNWAAKIPFEIDELVSPDIVLECLNLGGRTCGLLDFRPECGGPFGRFSAKLL